MDNGLKNGWMDGCYQHTVSDIYSKVVQVGFIFFLHFQSIMVRFYHSYPCSDGQNQHQKSVRFPLLKTQHN